MIASTYTELKSVQNQFSGVPNVAMGFLEQMINFMNKGFRSFPTFAKERSYKTVRELD